MLRRSCFLILLAAVLLFHWRVVFSPGYGLPWDARGFHLPLATAYADAIQERVLPLWEPYVYCGRPLLANPQAMVLYPGMFAAVLPGRPNLFYRLELLAILHIFLAGWLAYRLGLRLGMGSAAALLSGLMFSLGAFPASQAQHLGLLCGMPWLVFAWLALVLPRRWQLPALAFAFAGCVLTGFTPFAVMTAASTVVMSVALRLGGRTDAARLRTVFLAGLIAALLAAAQLVPAAELALRSVGKYRWEWLEGGGGVPPVAFLSLIWPNYQGVFDLKTYHAPFDLTQIYLFSSITGLVLAAVGFSKRATLGAAAALFCVLMIGAYSPLGRTLFSLLPQMARSSVYWYVYLAPFLLCLSLAAGFGAAMLSRRSLQWAAAALVIVECVAISSNRPMNSQKMQDEPLTTASVVNGEAAIATSLRELSAGDRYDTVNDSITLVTGAPILRLRTANGYDPLALERLIQVRLGFARGHRWGTYYQVEDPASPALDLLGVRVVTSRTPVNGLQPAAELPGRVAYLNPRALPRYRLVSRVHRVASMAEAAAKLRMRGFDPAMDAVAEDFEMIAVPSAASVRVVDETRQKVILETLCDHDSFLVTSEAHYPGWKVKLDGRSHPIYYSNAAFRGTPVPAGSHRIEMVFEPMSVVIGVLLSLAGLAICAATLVSVRSKTLR